MKHKLDFFDIETSKTIFSGWHTGKQYVGSYQVIQEPVILCAAWKRQGDNEIQYTDALKVDKKGNLDDKQVVKDICKGLADCEVLVGHNLDRFDVRWVNARAFIHRLSGLGPIRSRDTLKIAKKYMFINGYSLDYLATRLGIEGKHKIKNKDGMWDDVMAGDRAAYDEMITYNLRDVELLEEVYDELNKLDTGPIFNNEIENVHSPCPECGEIKKQRRGRILNLKTYRRRYQCMGCGRWLKSTLRKK